MAILWNCFVAIMIVGSIVGVAIFLLSRVDPNQDPDEKKSPYILQYGKKFLAYVVLPPAELYTAGWPENLTSCQMVFIKTPNVLDLEQRLKTLGRRLLTFQAAENAPKDERIIANVFKSQIGYFDPLRLPDRISDGLEAYTVAVKMRKSTFPLGWEPQPFFDILVVFDEPNRGARRANHVVPEKYRTST